MSSVVPISPVGPVAAATTAFRENGVLYVTAIVKATFAFAHDAPMPLVAPEPIFTREMHRMNNPTRSIVASSDLVPRMPAAEVLLLGHAHAPDGSAAHMEVRLAVGRGDSATLDKTLHVVGDRKGADIKVFSSMPLAYERAYGGPGCRDNPLGTGVLSGDALPNIVDPLAPDHVVGFGPIARSWPSRSAMVSADARARLDRPIAEIPPGFDFRFFHSAPADQRVSLLLGDEWIVLEGVNADWPVIRLQLPGAQARTRIVGGEADGRVFSLRADTLRIDADAERVVLVWRNSFPVREAGLGAFRLLAGLELPGAPIEWPSPEDSIDDAPPVTQVLRPEQRSPQLAAGGTLVLSSEEPALASTFSGTIEIADEEIESVHFDAPAARPTRDPKEGTLDLSNDVSVVGRAVMPFAGRGAPSAADAPGSDRSAPGSGATPIPGSPWDPGRFAALPLEEASTADGESLDLAGTLTSATRSPLASPVPEHTITLSAPEPATTRRPAMVAAPPRMAPLPEPPQVVSLAEPPTAPLPEPPQVVSLAEPPTAPLPEPPQVVSLAEPPTAPLPDPWGQALREAAEPAAPAPAPPAAKPADQSASVRTSLYKRFKK